MSNVKSDKNDIDQFEQFTEKNVTPADGNYTQSGFFGTNSFVSQKILGQTYKKQRKIGLSRLMTLLWAVVVLLVIIGVALIFIFNGL